MVKRILSSLILIFTIIITTTLLLFQSHILTVPPTVRAETGKGTDVFKVIMTIFGLKKSTGQLVAIVTVNNSSKVRVLDTSKINLYPVKGDNNNNSAQEGIMEFIAAFPNMTVNTG